VGERNGSHVSIDIFVSSRNESGGDNGPIDRKGVVKCSVLCCGGVFQIKNSYFLVSMVDNNYINGDLFSVFTGL
jgi:hypothetical protein